MKRLCYGVFANIIKLCVPASFKQNALHQKLFALAVEGYEPGDTTEASDCFNCRRNIPPMVVEDFRAAAPADIARAFNNTIAPLIDPSKFSDAVNALRAVIQEDTSIADGAAVDRVDGATKEALAAAAPADNARFLAGVLLYAVLYPQNKDGRGCVKSIDKAYMEFAKELLVSSAKNIKPTKPVEPVAVDIVEELSDATKKDKEIQRNKPVIDAATVELFTRSGEYCDYMRREGRFAFLEVQERLFPEAQTFDAFVTDSGDSAPRPLLDVLAETKGDLLIIGDGGMGKTTALLHVWQEWLENTSGELPIYIPLNDFDATQTFLRDYVKLNYNFSLDDVTCPFALMLDGYNELRGEQRVLIDEIKAIRLAKSANLRVIITSRHDYVTAQNLPRFKRFMLQPLNEATVREFLKESRNVADNALMELLKTPMLLTMFAEMSSIRKRLDSDRHLRGVFEFKDNDTRGGLIYDYLTCQLVNLAVNHRQEDVFPTWAALFRAAPFVAHEMERKGDFYINMGAKDGAFDERLAAYAKAYPHERLMSEFPDNLKHYLRMAGGQADSGITPDEVLLKRQYMLVEENGRYVFRHQYFRDFFSALHTANAVEGALAADAFALPEIMSERILPVYVREMLGGIYNDQAHTRAYDADKRTPLHELLDRLRGQERGAVGFAVQNILYTWRDCRENRIIGEDLSGLDLTHIPLNGIIFSDGFACSRFDECNVSYATFAPQGHSGSVNSAVYSNDESRILSASSDVTIREWNRANGECLRVYQTDEGYPESAVYSPKETRIAAAYDKMVRIWRRGHKKPEHELEWYLGLVQRIIYSRDGNWVLFGSGDGKIHEWCARTDESRLYSGHTDTISSLAYSSDGKRVLSASADGTVREWDRVSRKCLRAYGERDNGAPSAVYAGAKQHTVVLHGDAFIKSVTCAIYASGEQHIVAAYSNGVIVDWDRASGKHRVFEGEGTTLAVTQGEFGEMLLTAYGHILNEWDFTRGKLLHTYEGHSGVINSAVYSADGRRVLTASSDNSIREWDRESGFCLQSISGRGVMVMFAAVSRDGKRHIFACDDGVIRDWDAENGVCVRSFIGHADAVYHIAVSADGRRFLSSSLDCTIREWDRESGECLQIFEGHQRAVRGAAYSADGLRVLSFSRDATIREWERKTGVCRKIFAGHHRTIVSAAYRFDGERILSGSKDGTICEWDRETGACLRELQTPANDNTKLRVAVYGHDGLAIVATTYGGVYTWEHGRDRINAFDFYDGDDDDNNGDTVLSDEDSPEQQDVRDELDYDWESEEHRDGDDEQPDSLDVPDYGEEDAEDRDIRHSYRDEAEPGDDDYFDMGEYFDDDGSDDYRLHMVTNLNDGSIGHWDARTNTSKWSVPAHSGVYIAGCGFKGCRYENVEVAHMIRGFGGKSTGVHYEAPRGVTPASVKEIMYERFYDLYIAENN